MFGRNPAAPSELDRTIATAHAVLDTLTPSDPQYAKIVDQLIKLYAMKEEPSRISPDTLATVIGNLMGILVIVMYEQRHAMVSKALSFIGKTVR